MDGNVVYPKWRNLTVVLYATACISALATSAPCTAIAQQSAPSQPMREVALRVVGDAHRVTVDVENAPLSTVLTAIAARAGLNPAYVGIVIPPERRVTLHVRDVPALDAFRQALQGTGLGVYIHPSGNVFVGREEIAATSTSVITGVVTVQGTGRPLRDVTISVDQSTLATRTDEQGRFRLVGVSVGEHTVIARILGYTRYAKTVTVQDDATLTLSVSLAPSVAPLDQVVVTGMVAPTELKAVPNAITVITARDLEQRGITHIDQLFRGEIPGLFAQSIGTNNLQPGHVQMASRGSANVDQNIVNGTTALSQPIKTYVDGVELADPSYLGLIDPRSIDRIEVLTGPQASTIYGSNAINGVMQVFTKRGTTAVPQLTANLQSGLVQNNFSSSYTPSHDLSVQLSGVEGHISYSVGGSWIYMGPWTPAMRTETSSGFGGVHLQRGPFLADVSLRRVLATNQQEGLDVQSHVVYGSNGVYGTFRGLGFPSPSVYTSTAQTLGTTVAYTLAPWWSHTLTVGTDATDGNSQSSRFRYSAPSDTLLKISQTHQTQTSVAYTTTVLATLTSFSQVTLTVGADGYHDLSTSLSAQPPVLTGTLTDPNLKTSRQPGHNQGAFFQGQLGIRDAVFFTYGIRADWNPTFGERVSPNVVPRYGVVYTHDLGGVTAKMRASYGHSTRPPGPGLTQALPISGVLATILAPTYGNINNILANPNLVPEQQQGGEGGLELYFGTRGSLVVTRYNQTVDNLIVSAVADSARSLLPASAYGSAGQPQWTDGYLYYQQHENLNLGSIRNQGWELQGTVNTGPISTKGTYSWSKSRIIGVTPKYRAQFPQFVVGGSFRYVPEHTWALDIAYTRGGTSVSLNVQGQGLLYRGTDELMEQISYTRLITGLPRVDIPFTYVGSGPGYALSDVNASQRFSNHVDGVLQVQNMTNFYQNDFAADYATMGRQIKAGVRVRF